MLKKEDVIRLYRRAIEVSKHSYSPYSNFEVGAAIMDIDGKVFVGSNFENSSYGATICAERVALGSFLSTGRRKPIAIAIVGRKSNGNFERIVPCGICCQSLLEFNPDINIILGKNEEELEMFSLREIYKEGFTFHERI